MPFIQVVKDKANRYDFHEIGDAVSSEDGPTHYVSEDELNFLAGAHNAWLRAQHFLEVIAKRI
jgi:hypothetical protein